MDINFLPGSPVDGPPALAVSLEELRFVPGGIEERIAWAQSAGFTGVELLATGEAASGIHAPSVDAADRARLQELLDGLRVVVQAPHQQTWDVTLVSPSSAIRRASLSEIWAVCRFAGSIGKVQAGPPPLVLVRTGTPPPGVGTVRVLEFLRESLLALDRMAGEHGVRIGILNRDVLEESLEWEFATDGLQHTGIAFDISHALDRGTAPADCAGLLRRFAGLMVYVRVCGENDAAGHESAFYADTLLQTGYGGVVCLALPSQSGDAAEATGETACREWSRALSGDGDVSGSDR